MLSRIWIKARAAPSIKKQERKLKDLMKKFILPSLAVILAASFHGNPGWAQVETPRPSPMASLSQDIGFGKVEIEYSRPGVKGRVIFGRLVPFGELWRTGANTSTKILFTMDMTLNGHAVPAGDYALFTIPGKEEWTIIIHKDTSFGGTGGYDKANDLLRFSAKTGNTKDSVESFTIEFSDVTSDSANLNLVWERTRVPIHLEADIDTRIMSQIDKFSKNPEAVLFGSYMRAANYYMEKGKNLSQALEWVDKALEINPESFVVLHFKASILAEMGDSAGAIEAAEKSLAISSEINATGWVMKNEELLAKLRE